jgi:hypothetical protein
MSVTGYEVKAISVTAAIVRVIQIGALRPRQRGVVTTGRQKE